MKNFTFNSALGTKFLGHIKRKAGTLAMAAAVATAAFVPNTALAGEITDATTGDYTFRYHDGNGYTAKDVEGFTKEGYLHVYIVEGSDVTGTGSLAEAGKWNGNSVYYIAEDVKIPEGVTFKDNTLIIIAQGATDTLANATVAANANVTIASGYIGQNKSKSSALTGTISTLGDDATLNLYGIKWANGTTTSEGKTEGVAFISTDNTKGTVNIIGDTIVSAEKITDNQTGHVLCALDINIGKNSVVEAYPQANGKMTISDNAKVGTIIEGSLADPAKVKVSGAIRAEEELDIDLNSDGAIRVYTLECGNRSKGGNFSGTIKLADKSDTLLVTKTFALPEQASEGKAKDAMLTISKGTLYSAAAATPTKDSGAGNMTVSGDAVVTIVDASEASTFGTLNIETSDTVYIAKGATITELNITEADAGTTALVVADKLEINSSAENGKITVTPTNLAAYAVGFVSGKASSLDGTTGKKAFAYPSKDNYAEDSVVNTTPITLTNSSTKPSKDNGMYFFFQESKQQVLHVTFMIPAQTGNLKSDTATVKTTTGKAFKNWQVYGADSCLASVATATCPVDSFKLDGLHLVTEDAASTKVKWYTDSACTKQVDIKASVQTGENTNIYYCSADGKFYWGNNKANLRDTVLYAKLAVADSVTAFYKENGELTNTTAVAIADGSQKYAYKGSDGKVAYNSSSNEYANKERKFSELTAKVTSPKMENGTFAIALKDLADTTNISSLAAEDSITFPQALVKDTTWNLVLADSVVFFEDNSLKNPIKKTIVLYGDTLAESLIPAAPTKAGYVFDGWYYVTQDGEDLITEFSFDENGAKPAEGNLYNISEDAEEGYITSTVYLAPKWVIGVYAVIGEDTIPVAKLATKDFAAKTATPTEGQVDLYNTETMPIGIEDAPETGTSGVVLTQKGIVNLYYLPLNQDSVNAAGFTDGEDSKYDGERLNAAINWYTDADMTEAITSWPYSVKDGKTECVFIYGFKPVEIMQVFDGDTLIDTLASGTKYSEAFILDSLKMAEYLWYEKIVDVIGWKNNAGDTIASDYKWTKNDTLYPICDTVVVLNFYSNDDVNTLYQIIVHYGEEKDLTYHLTDTIKVVGGDTLTFKGWYVPLKGALPYDVETGKQWEWNEEIVTDENHMAKWEIYSGVYYGNVKGLDKEFGNNGIINIYGYWPKDTTGGDPTGINEVNGASENAKTSNGRTYNLAGQEVDSNYEGVVIKNGQKFVQK